jgi:hypothetical protein
MVTGKGKGGVLVEVVVTVEESEENHSVRNSKSAIGQQVWFIGVICFKELSPASPDRYFKARMVWPERLLMLPPPFGQ